MASRGFEVSRGAAAHVTTQASTIVHSMTEGCARQEARIALEPGSFFEYLPDPMILFPGARLASHLRIRFAPGTSAIICDSFLLHDPHGKAGEHHARPAPPRSFPSARWLAVPWCC